MSYANKHLIDQQQNMNNDGSYKLFINTKNGRTRNKGKEEKISVEKPDDQKTMTERINELNRGIISDIQLVPSKKFDSLDNQVNWNKFTAKDSVMFNDIEQASLKGIIEESSLSKYFFSDMNIKAINQTLRYRVYKDLNKTISNQSMSELSVIMRSIFLQNGNSLSKSDEILPNLKALNKMVIDYSIKKIEVNLEQYDGYIDKLEKLPEPISLPLQDSNKNFTYDISNLL
tara:strand:- start:590 stop:1279 length:690 start_codon:yes stop_codon:yes gene_type:complete